jgi:hypothetical protein
MLMLIVESYIALRRQRDVIEIDAELIATVHAEGLLGQAHKLVEGLVGSKDEDEHAVHVRNAFLSVAGLDHANCGLLIVLGDLAVPMHALVVAEDRIFGAMDTSSNLHENAFKHLLGGEELTSAGVDVLLPIRTKYS